MKGQVFMKNILCYAIKNAICNNSNHTNVSEALDVEFKLLWKNTKCDHDNRIISLFDKNYSWTALFDILKSEVEFFDTNTYDYIKYLFEKIHNISKSFPSVQNRNCDTIFPDEKEIEDYLDYYLKIVKEVSKHWDLLYMKENSRNPEYSRIVCELLTHFPARNAVSIYSPIVAETLLSAYKEIKQIWSSNLSKAEKEIMANVITQRFNNDLNYSSTYMRHPSAIKTTKYDFTEQTSKYISSYKTLNPLALFQKIKDYTKNYFASTPINIIIIGYVEQEEQYLHQINTYNPNRTQLPKYCTSLISLLDFLQQDPLTKNKQYNIDIYMNGDCYSNIPFKNGNVKINFISTIFKMFATKQSLKHMIKGNQLIFLLDCPFMYQHERAVLNSDSFADAISQTVPDTYSERYIGVVKKIQYILNLQAFSMTGHSGTINRPVNDLFLNFIKNATSKVFNTETYIFVSSLTNLSTSTFFKQYLIHTEKIEGQDVHFINFSSKSKVTPTISDNSITFNLLDVINAVNADLITDFNETNPNNILLSVIWDSESKTPIGNIKINIDYIDTTAIPENVISLINAFFNLVFSDINNNKNVCYLRECLIRVLSNHIISLNQIIILQKLKEYMFLNNKNRNVSINIFANNKATYSIKMDAQIRNFYTDVISNFSESNYSLSIRDILIARMRDVKIDPIIIYDNIIKTCEKMCLTKDVLYKNITKNNNLTVIHS